MLNTVFPEGTDRQVARNLQLQKMLIIVHFQTKQNFTDPKPTHPASPLLHHGASKFSLSRNPFQQNFIQSQFVNKKQKTGTQNKL